MRAALLAAVMMAVQALAAAPAGSVRGTVTLEGSPIPGCTVRISGDSLTREATTDEHGSYTFDALPQGDYEVAVALEGLKGKKVPVTVGAGVTTLSTAVTFPATAYVCNLAPHCGEADPSTRWEYPSCADYELNTSYIESAELGDRSAVQLLERRYASTLSWEERTRIAGALLGRIANDEAIWKELETHAANLLRFNDESEETAAKYAAYCAEHGYDEDAYLHAAWQSFQAAAMDRRSRPLLIRALASEDTAVVETAILGLATQHDEAALPLIEKALERIPSAHSAAQMLVVYQSEAADRVAVRFITDEDGLALYRELKRQWQ
ncbi:MAG TPA: carboxypeptidase-like regulatory domain-containing protein [Thermoanaerobaculia bacterium]|nr:carboxypeptidase-like regulatory domain-containing protein [Thermoanaerobaculia bacterium]